MKSYKVYQIDSFTRTKFRGNPAGVVPNADGLNTAQMQQIARELNNSETAFIFAPPKGAEYDIEVRFFTPNTEVPLCGHATIAAHYVRAILGEHSAGRALQKTKAGILAVDTLKQNGDFAIQMTQASPQIQPPLDETLTQQIIKALRIKACDLRADCPVCVASTGHSKVMVGIKDLNLLHSLAPNMSALASLSTQLSCNGFFVFTLDENDEFLAHGRMFAPAIGINEDPVTGNANGPLGAYLVHYGLFKHLQNGGEFSFFAKQGEAIGREGQMQVRVSALNSKPVLVQIIGEAVVAFETELVL